MASPKTQEAVQEFQMPPKRFFDDTRWICENVELNKQYPEQWIAVLNKEVVAAGTDLGEVERVARQKAEEAGEGQCVYWFVEGPIRARSPVHLHKD